jgi:hypothetical protein
MERLPFGIAQLDAIISELTDGAGRVGPVDHTHPDLDSDVGDVAADVEALADDIGLLAEPRCPHRDEAVEE